MEKTNWDYEYEHKDEFHIALKKGSWCCYEWSKTTTNLKTGIVEKEKHGESIGLGSACNDIYMNCDYSVDRIKGILKEFLENDELYEEDYW